MEPYDDTTDVARSPDHLLINKGGGPATMALGRTWSWPPVIAQLALQELPQQGFTQHLGTFPVTRLEGLQSGS